MSNVRRRVKSREFASFSNASPSAVRVVIEPWAVEFMLPSRSFCEVVSVGGDSPASIEVKDDEYGFIFWINAPGAVYEYWQDGHLVD